MNDFIHKHALVLLFGFENLHFILFSVCFLACEYGAMPRDIQKKIVADDKWMNWLNLKWILASLVNWRIVWVEFAYILFNY